MEAIDTHELWKKCLRDIEIEVSKPNFSTWFKNTTIIKEDDGVICIGVPNEFVKDWLAQKYHKLILKSLMGVVSNIRTVEYTITKFDTDKKEAISQNKTTNNRELPLQGLYINKDDNLNPRYIFDNFVVGPFNELAYAAAQAIINKPGTAYNPFFVYGNTGLGKTHLTQSIGNEIKKRHPEKKVHYTSLEKFSIDLVGALNNNKINAFKEKYRQYDCLIVDDIQFIAGRDKTQEELFHLFNTLYDANKQIIFSSDKHPNYIQSLEDRLKSRFAQGMIVDIDEPEFESRLAVLKAKTKDIGININNDVLEYIAQSVTGSIRELEGGLNIVVCQSQLKNKDISITEVKQLLKNNVRPKKSISAKEVVKIIADYYNIEEATVYDKTRRKEIVKARQIVMYFLREEFNISYPLIGQKLGGKDHTTVIHSCEKIKNDLKKNPTLVQELEDIKLLFK
jgi:chromosomal replication initiator protein